MELDRVTETRKLMGCWQLRFAGGLTLRVPLPVFRVLPLRPGDEVDTDVYQQSVLNAQAGFAMERALRLLSQRDYSEHALREKLAQSAYAPETADAVTARLKELRYLDDERYAAQLVERLSKRAGKRKIAAELRRKGIDETMSRELLEGRDDSEETAQAGKLLSRYMKGKAVDGPEARQRCLAYLARRGFSFETACKAFELSKGGLDDE